MNERKSVIPLIETNPEYQFVLLEEKHIEEVIQVFTKVFCDDEPMTSYLKMAYRSFKPFANAVVRKAVMEQVSVVITYQNKIVGCALTEDISYPLIFDFEVDPKFNYIFTLLEQLGESFFKDKKFAKNTIAHLFITAIAKEHRGKNLSKQINFKAMEFAFKKGFSFMYCEFTNYINEVGVIPYLNSDKKLIGKQIYKDFALNNVHPFLHLNGGANSYLWALSTDNQLSYLNDSNKNKTLLLEELT